MKDICAVSTPLAEGGISVIRISGDNAVSIGAKVFKPLSCKSVENMAGYSCAYGKIVDINGREVDDGRAAIRDFVNVMNDRMTDRHDGVLVL